MPAPQLHLTFGELVAHHAAIAPAMRAAVAREPVYTHLGSIFHDLPYYGNMIAEAIRYATRRPAIDAPWAYRMHCMRPERFIASYIESARTTVDSGGLTRDEGLALVGGILSHCALDLTLHPLVNYVARRDLALHGGHETYHHRLTEKYHALFFHVERLGEDVVGLPEFRRKTLIVKQGSLGGAIEPAILSFMRGAYEGAYGDAPSPERWSTWVRHFRHFGLLLASKLADVDSKKKRHREDLRRRYFQSQEFDFNEFYVHSELRVAELVNLAYDYFETGDFSDEARERFCTTSRIDDLAEPSPLGLPQLPPLPASVTRPRLGSIVRRPTSTRHDRAA